MGDRALRIHRAALESMYDWTAFLLDDQGEFDPNTDPILIKNYMENYLNTEAAQRSAFLQGLTGDDFDTKKLRYDAAVDQLFDIVCNDTETVDQPDDLEYRARRDACERIKADAHGLFDASQILNIRPSWKDNWRSGREKVSRMLKRFIRNRIDRDRRDWHLPPLADDGDQFVGGSRRRKRYTRRRKSRRSATKRHRRRKQGCRTRRLSCLPRWERSIARRR